MVYRIQISFNDNQNNLNIISDFLKKDKRITKIIIKDDCIVANIKYIMLEDTFKSFVYVFKTNFDKNKLFSYKYYENSCEVFAL